MTAASSMRWAVRLKAAAAGLDLIGIANALALNDALIFINVLNGEFRLGHQFGNVDGCLGMERQRRAGQDAWPALSQGHEYDDLILNIMIKTHSGLKLTSQLFSSFLA